MNYILERCCTGLTNVLTARDGGAARAELCRDLEVGGTTPSSDEITRCTATGLPINVLVRPRGGSFVYSEEEIAAMSESIRECAACGAAAVVVGALDSAGDIDLAACRLLVREAGSLGLGLTFHRAFDCCRDPFLALEQIIELGFDRILTSGQQPSAMEGAPLIRELIQKAGGRIAIMPGAGVTPSNIDTLHELTGAVEFHGTRLCATRL